MKRFTIATLLITSSLMAAMGNNMPSFKDYDTNNDGKITQQEFNYEHQHRMQERAEEGRMMRNAQNAPDFADIDTNGDGIINRNEFRNHQKMQMQNKNMNMNKNTMGKCTGQGMNQGMGKCTGQGMGQGPNR
ncbi:EF-hand domain-containing protein [Sulfurimonas sp. HSL3-2]|uniref:EF-hand domain-containing protein n=1 Tax=Hydrocurvibacter mobilis TaxID=3131936 RepID=UPI0031F8602F